MFTRRIKLSLLAILMATTAFLAADSRIDCEKLRAEARKDMQANNHKDAYDKLRRLCLYPDNDHKMVGDDLSNAITCLNRLNRVSETDELLEKTIEIHKNNWHFLKRAASLYTNGNHYGYIIAGEFKRGDNRGGGKWANALERDHVRALQLMLQALELVRKDNTATANDKSGVCFDFANKILQDRNYGRSWRLTYLTDLTALPDYDHYYNYGGSSAPPVDKDGNPVFHQIPESWEAAKNDGERWRWLLRQGEEYGENQTNHVLNVISNFSYNQFGVQTMRYYSNLLRNSGKEDSDGSGTWALHTLAEDETIAKLASGVKRFRLPDDYNFIKIWNQQNNFRMLARVFADRRQYDKAADYWKKYKEQYKNNNYVQQESDRQIAQILNPWGVFEGNRSQPAGTGAKLNYRFRNGEQVSFTAQSIDVKTVLSDMKKYIENYPRHIDRSKIRLDSIGYRLVHENETKYLTGEVARWQLDLKPRPNHFDKRITVTTPLQKAGAYLVEAKMKNGNISRIIVWLSDTAIVKKPLGNKHLLYVADAVTGKPVEKANVEFFGYRLVRTNDSRGYTYEMKIKHFAEFTDKDGQLLVADDTVPQQYNWMIVAADKSGRMAVHGFSGIWYANYHDYQYNQTKTFVITDRPVYRPSNTVKFQFWVRRAQYDKDDVSQFAGQSFTVGMTNPKGEKIFERKVTADKFGGFDGEFALPADATLGVYRIGFWNGHYLEQHGYFRVEEYKKPEFEVTVESPDKPVTLGEKVKAKITAKYYFGSPVTDAKIKYKILRYSHDSRWYPQMPWDWFYGNGYWWYAYDYEWYPGWFEWGCCRPVWSWFGSRYTPPEVVAEAEGRVGMDGTIEVEFDTALAKEIHGDIDHRYEITAEVTDQSRRTIVGTGKVLVARKPFKVYTWLDRGYYNVGETVRATFDAHTIDSKPVKGKGELSLLKISYKDGRPIETVAQKWPLDTDDEGRAQLQLKASEPGQYRLSYSLTDDAKHTIEGGYLFTVRGEGFDSSEFRFNDIEIITDKQDYRPGEKVKLMVNTNRSGGTVLLFVRPSNGVYLAPEVIRLDGKSVVREIGISKKDMPNIFVEALTVAGGQVHVETREIIVPPEKRVLNVEVQPDEKEYKPGQKAKVTVKLTDFEGKPFAGSTVLSVYDKSVEYISDGSNVSDIKEFFWKWRRRHYPRTEHTLNKYFGNLLKNGEIGMSYLGAFGFSVADDFEMSDHNEAEAIDSPTSIRAGGVVNGVQKQLSESTIASAESKTEENDRSSVLSKAAPMDEKFKRINGEKGNAGNKNGTTNDVPTMRTNFADTAYWNATVNTGADGLATVEFDMPENLTGWKIKCWGMGHGTKVGEGVAEVVTRKNVILRLQAPRFFVEKDEVFLSANVHNYLKEKKNVKVVLELDGDCIAILNDTALSQTVEIAAGGEARVDWRVSVRKEGEAVIRMKALTDVESDAMEMRFPVYVHGMDKMVPQCGVIRPESELAAVTIDVPAQRRVNDSRLEIRYSPSLAGAMVDALPYMVDYPYGCTEQTLNRFVPTVVTQGILKRMGVKLADIQKKRSNLNAQELDDDKQRAAQWKRFSRNPVFDEAEVEKMVKTGVARLTSMQCSDGGWGWFSGYGEQSYPHTTCVVVHGLQLAKANGVAIVPGTVERGINWLKAYQAQQVQLLKNALVTPKPARYKTHADNLDAFIYMVLADNDTLDNDMMEFLYRDRSSLSAYGISMFGIALHKQKQIEKRDMIVKNIEQFLVMDKENQTAYLNIGNDGYWWYWYGSEVEAHACYLKLLARVAPKSDKAAWLVKYMLNNRKHATYWNSTRDTAIAIEAFADYIAASGEDKPDMTLEILVDGKKMKEVAINGENMFTFDNKFVLLGDAVETGTHKIELRKKGTGPVYFNAYLSYFTLEDYIGKAGLEVKVQRKFYRLKKVDKKINVATASGNASLQKVEKYERELLKDLSTLKSGELVEVELEIDSKNDYEYVIFEDMKAAGFEAVDTRSGYVPNDLNAYVEFRDNRVSFFVRQLARGKHSVSYRLRAEIPGKFSALPARAYAMYAPELRGNSDEIKLNIED